MKYSVQVVFLFVFALCLHEAAGVNIECAAVFSTGYYDLLPFARLGKKVDGEYFELDGNKVNKNIIFQICKPINYTGCSSPVKDASLMNKENCTEYIKKENNPKIDIRGIYL